jgi:hypothetical protein
MTRITRIEVIDENGRSYVNWEDDNNVSWQFQDDGRTLKVFVNKVKPKSPVEEAYKRWMGEYPPTTPSVDNYEDTRWRAFQIGYNASQEPKKEQKWGDIVRESVKWCEEHPDESVEDYLKPQTPEQVDAGLRNAMRQAKKDGVFDEPTKPMNEVLDRLENKYKDAEENAASYMTDEVVNRMLKKWETDPPSFLRFELGKTLEALITRWWDDVYDGIHQDWDREVAIDDLIDQIQLWLPREQSHEGTQSASVIDLVDGYNDALTKIKSKLRNKKDT